MSDVTFEYSVFADSFEEQANIQGFTLGNDAERLQDLHKSLFMCWIHGLCTESQKDSMVGKLHEQILKSLKEKR